MPEDTYAFTCQSSGMVNMTLSGMDCNLDIYILDDTCDPNLGCIAGTTNQSVRDEHVSFTCTSGHTYYVVVEGYGYSRGVPAGDYCDLGEGNYTLSFDVSAGTGCSEDCDDGVDNDFDGNTDCYDSDCASDPVCDYDFDNDGYNDIPHGGADCDDTNAAISPGAPELCNGIDDNCDGTIDEATAVDAYTYARDADGDGYGNAAATLDSCISPAGYVIDDTDCDDTRATTHPGATEVCDTRDNDCDGAYDEGLATTWYRDADGDSFGTSATTTTACAAPSGYVAVSTDCDDASATVHPGAAELCNVIDDDCDGIVDDGIGSVWYTDGDADGYGNAAVSTLACAAPAGYLADATDCNDALATVHPGAAEACNSVDDDCDGSVDEGSGLTWYVDTDGDAYGNPSLTTLSCAVPAGYVADATDCNDAAATVHPARASCATASTTTATGSPTRASARPTSSTPTPTGTARRAPRRPPA